MRFCSYLQADTLTAAPPSLHAQNWFRTFGEDVTLKELLRRPELPKSKLARDAVRKAFNSDNGWRDDWGAEEG